MSSKHNIVHKQQFQNAQQVIEVTVKSKPRAKLGLKTKAKVSSNPFVRDCLLKKELEQFSKELEDKRLKIKANKMNPERPMPKLNINQPNTVVEIYKKSRKKMEKKNHDILPPGVTWGEFLENLHSSKSSLSNTSEGDSWKDVENYPKLSVINEDECQIPEKLESDRPISKKHISEKRFGDPKKRKHRIHKKPDPKIDENVKQFEDRREAQVLLPTNSCNPLQINRSMQTSFTYGMEIPRLDQPDNNNKPVSKFLPTKLHPIGENITKQFDDKREAHILLDMNSDKPLQINRSIQTSRISGLEIPTPDQLDIQKPIKSQTDQTHSPFSESALKLLRQLRDRLHSQGDSEGSGIVHAIEAYFGSAEGKSNQGNLDIGDSASPVFPPVFSQKEIPVSSTDFEKERLTRIITEQDKKIEEQDQAIQELKSLSTRLLAYHEQLAEQIIQSSKNIPSNLNPSHSKALKKNENCDLSASEDLSQAVKKLKSERDALVRENRIQRDVILNLEVKLSQFEMQKELFEKNKYTVTENKQATSDEQFNPLEKDANVVEDKVSQVKLPCHTPPNDSEADSAFEDKSYKSSRPTSKASSNINNKNSVLDQIEQLSIPNRVVNRPVLSELGLYVNNNSNRGGSAYERFPKVGRMRSYPAAYNNSIQPISDVSSDYSTNIEENIGFEQGNTNIKGNMFSETSVHGTLNNYFESTHLDKRKTNTFKPSVVRRGFESQLSHLHSDMSVDEMKLVSLETLEETKKGNLFSEKSVYTTPDNYIESTQLNKMNTISKPCVARRGFETQLKHLHSDMSADEMKLVSLITD